MKKYHPEVGLKTFFLVALVCLLSNHQANATTVAKVCQELNHYIPSISEQQCLKSGFSSISLSTENRTSPLIFKRIDTHDPKKPNILVLGGIHANEQSSFVLAIKWLNNLLKQDKHLFNWLIAPAVNINALKQKNPTRTNINQVDINRNFPLSQTSQNNPVVLWQILGSEARHYPGPKPFSEIETQVIEQLINTFKPTLIISIHAPLNLIDYDGPPQNAPKKLGSLPLDLTASYPGSLASYYWNTKRIPVLTIELADPKKLPSAIETSHIWYDLTLWLKKQHYPNLVYKDDVMIFNEAMAALSLNNLSQSALLFSQISDKTLLLQAKNNIAYILYLQNKKKQAMALWEQIIAEQNNHIDANNLAKIKSNHLMAQEQESNTTNNLVTTPQLIQIPVQVLQKSNDLEAIRWRLYAWENSQRNGEQNLYFSLYMPNHSPTKKSYKQWQEEQQQNFEKNILKSFKLKEIKHKILKPNQQAISTFRQIFQLRKIKATYVSTKEITWVKDQNIWKIISEKNIYE
jgi:hypothetical protein